MRDWSGRITRHRYFYHYLFWFIVLLSYFVDAAELRHYDPPLFFRTLVLKNGLLIGIVYFHLRVLIPTFLTPKRYFAYTVSLLMTLAAGTLLTNKVENISWRQVYHAHSTQPDHSGGEVKMVYELEQAVYIDPLPQRRLLLDALTVCRYLVISVLLKFIDDFFRQRDQLQRVQQEKTMAELDTLKAQVNPHFLFNTLNNLYGLVLERSDLAPETVLKLADIMKYTLTEGHADQVPLQKDLDNLRHYFDLEKLRLPDAADVLFDISGTIGQQRITPLLLLPLVENAFKYGVHRSREKPSLHVRINVRDTTLEMTTRNTRPVRVEPAESLGIGLSNLRRRLDLLYPGRYRFETAQDHEFFRVTLQLQLA